MELFRQLECLAHHRCFQFNRNPRSIFLRKRFYYSLQSYFVLVPWLLMFIIPAISMKTLAEEQQSGTLNWLFSQPVKISEIILGKFLAVWFVGVLCLLPSLTYLYTVYTLGVPAGNIDLGATFGSYFGLIILTAAFSAVGILGLFIRGVHVFYLLFRNRAVGQLQIIGRR